MAQNPIRISELPLISPLPTDQLPIVRGSGSSGLTYKTNLGWIMSYLLQTLNTPTVTTTFDSTATSIKSEVNLNSITNDYLAQMPPSSIKVNTDPTFTNNPIDLHASTNTTLIRQNGSLTFKGGSSDQVLRVDSTGTVLDFGPINLNSTTSVVGTLATSFGGMAPINTGVRMSLDPLTPTPTTDRIGTNANTIYLHPYKGNTLPLYNTTTNSWVFEKINSILSFPLVGTGSNTNFDIFAYKTGSGSITLEYVPWTNSSAGISAASPKILIDGVFVKSGQNNKRFLGCTRTTITGQSEQSFGSSVPGGSHPKQFLWNAYNQISVSCYSFDSDSYNHNINSGVSTGWVRVNSLHSSGGNENRFSFVVGETTYANVNARVYPASTSASITSHLLTHVALGINSNTTIDTTGHQMIGTSLFVNQTPTAHLSKPFTSGFNYIQMFEKLEQNTGGSMTITMNGGSQQHTGLTVTLLN